MVHHHFDGRRHDPIKHQRQQEIFKFILQLQHNFATAAGQFIKRPTAIQCFKWPFDKFQINLFIRHQLIQRDEFVVQSLIADLQCAFDDRIAFCGHARGLAVGEERMIAWDIRDELKHGFGRVMEGNGF